MCNNFASRVSANSMVQAFSETASPLRFDHWAVPNLQSRDDIRIGDLAPVVTWADGPLLSELKWAWKSPQGRPVFNFRSDGRNFEKSSRCLIPANAFYEFTDAEPGQKRKTKWSFTVANEEWFWIAGLVKDGAWAMLTTEPGPDIAPYHDRQIVVLGIGDGLDWLTLQRPQNELLKPSTGGSLSVGKVSP